MISGNEGGYPHCSTVIRMVEVQGYNKSQRMEQLHKQGILMNDFGKWLFVDERFLTSNQP